MRRWRDLPCNAYVIAAVAFAVRLGYFAALVHARPAASSRGVLNGFETVQIATSIATGKGFSSPLAFPSGPTAWLTPVFPYLLAGVFKLFGVGSFASELVIKSLDALFSSLVCVPLVALGKRVGAPVAGVLSAWFWAFLPGSILYSIVWVWDTSLTALCLAVLLYFTLVLPELAERRHWLAYGALWAFSVLTNPILLSALPGFALLAIYRARSNNSLWLRNALAASLVLVVGIAPWIIRNEIAFKGQVALRSNFALELWLGNNPQVGELWAPWLHPANDRGERARFQQLGEVAYMKEKQRAALRFIATDPADALEFTYRRFMTNWTGGDNYLNDFQKDLPFKLRVYMLLNCSFSLLSFVGVWVLYRKNPVAAIPFAWVMFTFPLVYYITHPSPRYRIPLEPCMAFLTVYALVSAYRCLRPASTADEPA